MSVSTTFAGAVLAASLSVLTAAPASAQVQQGNPDAANRSMATMGANRAAQQNATSQSNTATMTMQRNQAASPPPSPSPLPRPGVSGR